MGLLQTVGQQFSNVWTRLSIADKVIIGGLGLICAGAIAGVIFWAGQPDYEIVYSGLSSDECTALVAAMKEGKIAVRVTDNGTAIMVPARQVNEARMKAAEKGVPKVARGGFESFREPKIGMTPFAEHVNYISALQGDLAATICTLDAVQSARVHLVIPEHALFKEDEAKASASVLIVPRGSRQLLPEQVVAITNLVASAVEGLNPRDVTVSDDKGNVLASAGAEGDMQMVAGDQFAYRQKVESYLTSKTETMLTRVLGYGRCQVRISAEIAFQDSKETTREYDPKKKVAIREKSETNSSIGTSSESGGAVGAASNVPNAAGNAGGARTAGTTGQETKTENTETQYMVGETVRETVNKGSSIKRLSIAAIVDLSSPAPSAKEGEKAAEKAAAETAAAPAQKLTVEDISRIIKDAVGFDEKRGDTLKIAEATFSPATAGTAEAGKEKSPQWMVMAAEYFAIGILGLVLFFIARRVMKVSASPIGRGAASPEVTEAVGEGLYPARMSSDDMVQQEITRFVKGNPEMAGRMLEGWVESEE